MIAHNPAIVNTHCPHCGGALLIQAATPGPMHQGGWQQYATLQHAMPAPGLIPGSLPTESEWQKVTPVDRLQPRDVLTAGLDAAVSFSLVTIAAGGVCLYFDLYLWPAPAVGLSVAVWRYFNGLALAKGLLEIVETLVQKDIDRDGHTGPAKAEPHTVRVEIKQEKQWNFIDLGVEPLKLQRLANEILAGHPFTERTAAGCGLTQEEFGHIRDEFINRSLAKWNHPSRRQQGVSLTRGGKAALQAIISAPLPPAAAGQRENSLLAARSSTQHESDGWDYE